MTDTYIDREVGHFPSLSIGTSLALEGLFEIHPSQAPLPSGHRRINQVWVNLRTLVRNFYAAMPTEEARKAPLDQSVEVLLGELDTLYGLPNQKTKRTFQVTVYVEDLEQVKWQFRHALFKKPKTERQIYFHRLEELLLQSVLTNTEHSILRIKRKPPTNADVVAILTHHPHHLLWRSDFDTLFLLESHTGKLKPYGQWFSKLNGVVSEDRIPFNRFTLQLFGDGVVFEPFPKLMRDEVRQIAQTRRWSAITTMEKIKDNIRNYGGEALKELVYKLA